MDPGDGPGPARQWTLSMVLIGAGFEAGRRALDLASAVTGRAVSVGTSVVRRTPLAGLYREVETQLGAWTRRGRAERVRLERELTGLLRRRISQVVQLALEDLDLDEVAGRIDVDALAERIDLQRQVDRLDLVAIAQEVIEGLELPELIRESSGVVAVEAVDALREGGMSADRFISRVVDRLLGRSDGRILEAPGSADGEATLDPERPDSPSVR